MKKILALVALFQLSLFIGNAQTAQTTITCNVYGGNDKTVVSLYTIKNGEGVKIATTKPDENNVVVFDVDAKKEGVYFVVPAASHNNRFKNVIYLKSGNKVSLTGYIRGSMTMDFDSCYLANPNEETKVLQAWLDMFYKFGTDRIINKSFDFYKGYAELETSSSSLLKTNKCKNAHFNALLKDKINVDLTYLKVSNYFYGNLRVGKCDTAAAVQPFYKSLNDSKILNTTASLRSERGLDLLPFMLSYWNMKKGINSKSVFENTQLITNDTVKAYYMVGFFGWAKTYEEFAKYVMPYKNVFNTPELKDAYDKKYRELTKYAKGVPALNFSLKDINDKTYTLASFKGKVMVIDLWATWCTPCRREKPTFLKTEEEYKSRNDIVFVGVSQDKIKEKETWKKFVKENNPNGVELLDYENLFTSYYDLSGIPRYLIFDRDGKVFTADAPRPTDPAFKKAIEAALAGK